MGRDLLVGTDPAYTGISIHAPAWGATGAWHIQLRLDGISIHAPAWGATIYDLTQIDAYYFNPRARMGRDSLSKAVRNKLKISIHAPAWGATQNSIRAHGYLHFNPRARMGRDRKR